MHRDSLAGRAKQIIDRLAAEPRAAGSEAEARGRAYCADILRSHGFVVTEEEFTYSAFPGRWAVPLVGLLFFAWFVFVGSRARAHPAGAVGAGIPFLLLLPALGYMLARIIPRSRLMGRRATNLVAVRGDRDPVWLVAHLDSKSQPVPMLVRIGAIIVASVAMVVTVAVAMAVGFTEGKYQVGDFFWVLVSVAGAVGSLAMMLSLVGDRSQGAVDNASGVASALLVASELPADHPAGVVITSAEELGLQGARAWVRRNSTRPASAINFDGIDDVGTLTCMASRRSPLATRLRSSAEQGGSRMRFRGVLPGIMVDSSALNRSNWDAVTISKGNFSTLARIHTPGDSPGRLNGTGVAEAVELVTNFIRREV
ncbi:MAG: M28 family peptidase [Gemmatimonadaceae bacterium]